ncbi:MAG TPA: hypothetical protein VM802_08140, partial [Chitinophaga sp.]|uniref:hypothetical protein n=1 Tax=Chitinophaga sp. TaxID=1869181 RepID=UPI002BC24CAC
ISFTITIGCVGNSNNNAKDTVSKNISNENSTESIPVKGNTLSLDSACAIFQERARRDFQRDSLKLYYHGIAAPSKKLVDTLKSKKIQVVPLNCLVDKELLCYNQIADSVIKVKFGITLSALIKSEYLTHSQN